MEIDGRWLGRCGRSWGCGGCVEEVCGKAEDKSEGEVAAVEERQGAVKEAKARA